MSVRQIVCTAVGMALLAEILATPLSAQSQAANSLGNADGFTVFAFSYMYTLLKL